MDAKDNLISELQAIIAELRDIVAKQGERIAQLEQEVSQHKNRKNSRNSSMPPSTDLSKPVARPNQSLRPKSQRKTGGQPGHTGETLTMSPDPDKIERLVPLICKDCQHSLSQVEGFDLATRQVIEVPVIKPFVVQYEQVGKICPCCQHMQKKEFPAHVNAPIQYGPGVMSTVAYMHTRQFLSLARIKELMSSLFGIEMSEGTIVNLLEKMAEKLMPAYQLIKNQILDSGYAGADETGCKVDGKKHWIWAIQNERGTFIWQSKSRGYEALEIEFGSKLNDLILIHDCWAAYFQTGAQEHQLCLAHLKRDLQYLAELFPKQKWVDSMQTLFSKALALKREMEPEPTKAWQLARKMLEEELKLCIQYPLENAEKQVITFKKRLQKHIDHLTTFLNHYHIPPDNNGSERAIRNIKVKTKISGQFKSETGADIFVVVCSVTDTLIKQDLPIFESLQKFANG